MSEDKDRTAAASQRIQDAGVMSKAIADEFLRRHPEAVEVTLAYQGIDLRSALANFVAVPAADEDTDEPEDATDAVSDEDLTNG